MNFSVTDISHNPCSYQWRLKQDYDLENETVYEDQNSWIIPRSPNSVLGEIKHKLAQVAPPVDQRQVFVSSLPENRDFWKQNRNWVYRERCFSGFISALDWQNRGHWVNDLNILSSTSNVGKSVRANSVQDFQKIISSHNNENVCPKPGVEVFFANEKLQLKGKIDRLEIDKTSATITEMKSHGLDQPQMKQSEYQCRLYALAVSEFYPDLEIVYQIYSFKDKDYRKYLFTSEEKQNTALQLENYKGDFTLHGKPIMRKGVHCGKCRYRAGCSAYVDSISTLPVNSHSDLFDLRGTVTSMGEEIQSGVIDFLLLESGDNEFRLRGVFIGFDSLADLAVGQSILVFNAKPVLPPNEKSLPQEFIQVGNTVDRSSLEMLLMIEDSEFSPLNVSSS